MGHEHGSTVGPRSAMFGGRAASRGWASRRLTLTALSTVVCAAASVVLLELLFVPGINWTDPLNTDLLLPDVCRATFPFAVILLGVGMPAPPQTPGRGAFTWTRRPERLFHARATMVGTAFACGMVVDLYYRLGLTLLPEDDSGAFAGPIPRELPLLYGLLLGAFIGASLAVLRWARAPGNTRTPTSRDAIQSSATGTQPLLMPS
ncbi:hypothetical protein [Streptomyces sp. NPDC050759]|uniref:hypothetical protein n=1 Tax=Streptomyces sp. NPDC050759 TaxID=3365635 RepID=UPI00379110E4